MKLERIHYWLFVTTNVLSGSANIIARLINLLGRLRALAAKLTLFLAHILQETAMQSPKLTMHEIH